MLMANSKWPMAAEGKRSMSIVNVKVLIVSIRI